jgi:UDP:flavonoid glycosyltransferase YjiC (YdhE family)
VARILLITSEMAGRVNATCELARRLRRAGHEATIAGPAAIGPRVAAHDMTYVEVSSSHEGDDSSGPSRSQGFAARLLALVRRLASVRAVTARQEAKVAELDPDGIADRIRTLAPELVLVDMELPVHLMAAWSTGAPIVVWTTMMSVWKRPGLPPLGSAIVPGSGWGGTGLGIEGAWLVFRAWKWLREQRLRITRMGTDQLSILRRVAVRTGFPLRRETRRYQWLIPFVYRSLPALSFNAFELELPHRPLPVCHYVGPMLDPGRRATADGDAKPHQRLDALFARRHSHPERRLIYCSFGAWHKGDDRDFIGRVIAAVAARPDWDLIVGLGARLAPATLGYVPDNVHVFGWSPQMEVLAQADLAIHHGGVSSVNECIAAGVPMVVYPFDFLDQPGNCARVAYHQLGEVGDRRRDTAAMIRLRIERTLRNELSRSRVDEMRKKLRTYEIEDRAVRTIERFLEPA